MWRSTLATMTPEFEKKGCNRDCRLVTYDSYTISHQLRKEPGLPIVEISLFEGRSEELKATIAREVAATIAEYTQNTMSEVHVLFHEKERDQWARGATLASRRDASAKAAPVRPEAASISRIEYDAANEADYLAWRRDILHPGMARMPGYVGARLYRVHDASEYYLILDWMTREDHQHYSGSAEHDAFKETAMSLLPKPLDTVAAERVHIEDR